MKKLNIPTLAGSPITVFYCGEYDEYQVRVKGNKNATYFTNDRKDALQTAQVMRNTVVIK
jgi:hypothetical protein